jgi:DNA-binding MarR family transcriptional regulator
VGTSRDEDDLRILLQQVTRTIRRQRIKDELTDAQLSVLFEVERLGTATPSQLAEIEGVSPPAINRTLNVLQQRGLVTRAPSTGDGRRVLIELTEAGDRHTKATRGAIAAWFSKSLAALTPEERAALEAAIPALQRLTGR